MVLKICIIMHVPLSWIEVAQAILIVAFPSAESLIFVSFYIYIHFLYPFIYIHTSELPVKNECCQLPPRTAAAFQ